MRPESPRLGVVGRFLARPVNEDQTKPPKRQRFLFILGIVLLCIPVSALLAMLYFIAPPDDLCANDITSTDVCPNGALKAVLFRRDCGATTTYSTHVTIISASRALPNEAGNVFVQSGEPMVIVRWIDDRHLSISGGGSGTAFVHLSDFRGVRITYD